MKATIRRAKTDDLDCLQRIARHTINKNYRTFLGNEGVDWFLSGPSDEYIRENIKNIYVIISNDNEIIGFCALKDNLIDLMMIRHEMHRQGVGSQLLAFCEDILFKKYHTIKLESFEQNCKANNFYCKNGWINSGLEFDEISGVNKLKFAKEK